MTEDERRVLEEAAKLREQGMDREQAMKQALETTPPPNREEDKK